MASDQMATPTWGDLVGGRGAGAMGLRAGSMRCARVGGTRRWGRSCRWICSRTPTRVRRCGDGLGAILWLKAIRRVGAGCRATPPGMANVDFGRLMNWGTGPVAREQIPKLSADALREAGLTPDVAQQWADFYRNEAVRVPTDPSALRRADLMQAAANLLRGKP